MGTLEEESKLAKSGLSDPHQIVSMRFNQDASLFTCATQSGFHMFNSSPF